MYSSVWPERLAWDQEVGGSNPSTLNLAHWVSFLGGVAQLGEHLACNQKVAGSSPVPSIKALVSEIGTGAGLKPPCSKGRAGSSPAEGSKERN